MCFQKVFFGVVYLEVGRDPLGQKAHKCLKEVFSGISLSSSRNCRFASQSQESEKHRLEITVWNPYGLTHIAAGLGGYE